MLVEECVMAKGIIVVDIPESCRNIRGDENGCPFGGMVCQICDKDVMKHTVHGTKPDWCPIKEMPEKKEIKDAVNMTSFGWIEGFNACLDEIEGKM